MGLEESRARSRIGDVIGADHQRDISLREFAIDVIHLDQPVVGNVGFGQQHIHVSWHAARDGMDGKSHIHTSLAECVIEFTYLVLSLRDRHAITRNNDDLVGGGQDCGRFFRRRAADRLCFCPSCRGSLNLAECAEENIAERAVHGLGHDDRQDKPEEPSSAPAMIRSLLSRTNPMAAAESPA